MYTPVSGLNLHHHPITGICLVLQISFSGNQHAYFVTPRHENTLVCSGEDRQARFGNQSTFIKTSLSILRIL